MIAPHHADFESPEFTLQLLEDLVRLHGMTDSLFKRLHHLPETARINGHRAYCRKHVREGRRFRSPGNPETAERMAICLSALRAGAGWDHAIGRAVGEMPFAHGRAAGILPPLTITEEGNVRPELRAFAWEQLKRMEKVGLGEAVEVSAHRDKLVLYPSHPAAAHLTTAPYADGFIRADKGSLLYRNASPEFIGSVPRSLALKSMNSAKGLEFRWTQLSEADIRTLADAVLHLVERWSVPARPRFEPISDPDELVEAVRQLAAQPQTMEPPPGQRVPERVPTSRGAFRRCPHVIDWVLREAEGKCEHCRTPAPFRRADGTPFLEVHHVRRLADGGSDTVANAVALCPNCHRLLHRSGWRCAARR